MRVPCHAYISSLRSARASFKFAVPEVAVPEVAVSVTTPSSKAVGTYKLIVRLPAPIAPASVVAEAPEAVVEAIAPDPAPVEEPAPAPVKRTRKRKAEVVEAPVEAAPADAATTPETGN